MYFQVHLYQLFGDADSTPAGARLIGVRLISAARSGWEVFSISEGKLSYMILYHVFLSYKMNPMNDYGS